MPKILDGNILNVTEGIICHQVNCKGVMGAGIALQIRRKWPNAYEEYRRSHLFLGNTIISEVGSGLYVAHLCGQDRYGREPGRVYTNYTALNTCMTNLAKAVGNRQIYVPYGMGCVNAGGDWMLVSDMIDVVMPNAIVVKLS